MTLLFPQPFGPTIAVTPPSKANSDRSGKLLNPDIFIELSRMYSYTKEAAQTGCRKSAPVERLGSPNSVSVRLR